MDIRVRFFPLTSENRIYQNLTYLKKKKIISNNKHTKERAKH